LPYRRNNEIAERWQASLCTHLSLTVPALITLSEAMFATEASNATAVSPLRHLVGPAQAPVIEIPRGSWPRTTNGRLPVGYGFGIGGYVRGLIGHDGTMPGQSLGLRIAPQSRIAVVVAMNGSDIGSVRQRIFDAVFDLLELDEPTIDPSLPNIEFRERDLLGHYIGRENLVVDVGLKNGRLALSMGNGKGSFVKVVGSLDATGAFYPKLNPALRSEMFEGLQYTFFADPTSGAPCLMLGTTALKKCGD